jgi:FKBP-type peptidyl-prolyl cis-trans isomerase FklB
MQRFPGMTSSKLSRAAAATAAHPMAPRALGRLACSLALGGLLAMQAQSPAAAQAGAAQRPAAAASAPAGAASAAEIAARLSTTKDKMSYATGVMTARNLKRNAIGFDADMIVRGLQDAVARRPLAMDEVEIRTVLTKMQNEMKDHLESERTAKGNANLEHGFEYQEAFRKLPGAVVLPGNLMYREVTAGKGDRPTEESKVVLRYRGTLVDGTEFEATPEGKTVTMKVGDLISGWREAIKRMTAGSTWVVVVPPSLAYGKQGAGEKIGPNETLVFNVDLVAVVQ